MYFLASTVQTGIDKQPNGSRRAAESTKLGSTSINGHGIGMVIVLGGLVMTTISGRSSAHASIPKAISARTAETFSRISGTCTHAAVGAGGGPAGVVKPAEKYALLTIDCASIVDTPLCRCREGTQ